MQQHNEQILEQTLRGRVAVVAGATRGAGRGIAVELGAAGATVYCTGRSVRGQPSPSRRPETIDETAEMVAASGGVGIPVQVDHLDEEQVKSLFERVGREQGGRLDILVNDIWGGEGLTEWDKPFWEQDAAQGLGMLETALHTHLLTNRWGVPLMVARNSGLIIEVGDGTGYDYRGSLFYSLAKVGVVHLAAAMAADLREQKVTCVAAVALTPGYLRSEGMLDHWGMTEAQWQEGVLAPDFQYRGTESPHYIGRAVVALASDPGVGARSGQSLSTWGLMDEYGFTDLDGRQPNWGILGMGPTPRDSTHETGQDPCEGQQPREKSAGFMVPLLNSVVVYARDVRRSASFYQMYFGFTSKGSAAEGLVELVAPGGGAGILVLQAGKGVKLGQAAVKITFSVRDVEAFKETSSARGLEFGITHQANGYAFANTKDPDGNSVGISNRAYRSIKPSPD